MKELTRKELIKKYLNYYESKGHKIIGSASIIPENDPTVLFTTAGMHPLVPYLLGQPHPSGKRLTDVQKCLRTGDIDEVGDDCHLTFFEMLGNWSLGDYFKETAIKDSFEFLTGKDYLNLPLSKLAFTVFAGNDKVSRDEESFNHWKSLGVSEDKIHYLSDNWWGLDSGEGPCGPDTEMFVHTECKCSDDCKCTPAENCGCYVEVWNDVFLQYEARNGEYTELKQKNVDTGMGLERALMLFNNYESVYDTDQFRGARGALEAITGLKYEDNTRVFRIILDHVRTATFVLGDDMQITPSNTGRGYVLRRIIRRAIRYIKNLGADELVLTRLADEYVHYFGEDYPELLRNQEYIMSELNKEWNRFDSTINKGIKMFNKVTSELEDKVISGEVAFKLFDTFGFPLEFTCELADENGYSVDKEGFDARMKEHQELSRTASKGEFKGGLADHSYESVKYHTLAHILLATLREMYGTDVIQKGQNITPERLRFDFPLDHKMTPEEIRELTTRVNNVIKSGIPVVREEMDIESAKKTGALGIFTDKYGDVVSIYTIGDVSKEFCGGPHVENTSELGIFKVMKEESSSAGVRRIKAVLVDEK